MNLTVRILREIRDEIRKTNDEVRKTNDEVRKTNERVDAVRTELGDRVDTMRTELGARIVESELRTATAITELATNVREMTAVLRVQHDLRPRLERCEQDIADLRARLPG